MDKWIGLWEWLIFKIVDDVGIVYISSILYLDFNPLGS